MKFNPEKIVISVGVLLVTLVIAYMIFLVVWWLNFDSNASLDLTKRLAAPTIPT